MYNNKARSQSVTPVVGKGLLSGNANSQERANLQHQCQQLEQVPFAILSASVSALRLSGRLCMKAPVSQCTPKLLHMLHSFAILSANVSALRLNGHWCVRASAAQCTPTLMHVPHIFAIP